MFGMGWQEIILILVIGVLVIGPEQLPGVARTIGKLVAQFKRATNDLKNAVSEEFHQNEEYADLKEFTDDLQSEVNNIRNTAEDYVDKEIKKGEQDLELLNADLSAAVDAEAVGTKQVGSKAGGAGRKAAKDKPSSSPTEFMPSEDYGPVLNADNDEKAAPKKRKTTARGKAKAEAPQKESA